ncbi:hypothetical protein [Pseudomonas sp. A-RE-26]|uniref:hypothetical protein n=1 Tax=Pseudomonas sp. A-RE-26 TaxID=2832402 RepID=UPI001CBCCD3C|nr:hypothetical protein [Pseudomonas sp. A-RE-26]
MNSSNRAKSDAIKEQYDILSEADDAKLRQSARSVIDEVTAGTFMAVQSVSVTLIPLEVQMADRQVLPDIDFKRMDAVIGNIKSDDDPLLSGAAEAWRLDTDQLEGLN